MSQTDRSIFLLPGILGYLDLKKHKTLRQGMACKQSTADNHRYQALVSAQHRSGCCLYGKMPLFDASVRARPLDLQDNPSEVNWLSKDGAWCPKRSNVCWGVLSADFTGPESNSVIQESSERAVARGLVA